MNVKPGIQTTEFWLTLIVNALLLGLPVLAGKLGDPQTLGTALVCAAVAGLTTAAYTLQRFLAKSGATKAGAAVQVASAEANAISKVQTIVQGLIAAAAAAKNGEPKS